MAVPTDPRLWTPEQRAGVMWAELAELLQVVPTERTAWAEGPERTADREARAEEISARMTRVYEARPKD